VKSFIRKAPILALSAAAFILSAPAQAQSSSAGTDWWPTSMQSYVGLNGGRSHFNSGRGDAYSLYVGTMWPSSMGLEAGGIDFGRAGGTDAYGFYLAGVGRLPLNDTFAVFGKLGVLYSRSDNAGARDNGFGETYGVGVDVGITRQLMAVLQYDRSAVHLNTGRDRINTTSLGLKYRY
jgi:hypothetical protein